MKKNTYPMTSQGPFIIDTETKNMSFIQTAIDLKNLGIKNCYFHLALFDKSLQGVDPYDPFLTQDTIMRILYECTINPWYFLREVSKIPDTGGVDGVHYQLNRATLAQAWCVLNGIDTYLVIPRQIGKTQSTIAIILWAFQFGSLNTQIAFLNIEMDKSKENMDRLRAQRDLLPHYMRMDYTLLDDGSVEKGKDSATKLYNANTKNTIIPKGKAMSTDAAERIGRGNTQAIQYYDEFDFMNKNTVIMEAGGPAYATASENAEKNGSMYARIFTSTPGDLDSESGKGALEVVENTLKWSEAFYDKGPKYAKEALLDSRNGIMYIEYSYIQLGKDRVWFDKVCRLVNYKPLKIKREILLQRLHGSVLSPYDPNDLAMIEEYKGTIIDELFIYKTYKVQTYAKLDRHKIYFLGIDVSSGYGEDNSAITIWDPYTMKTVAEFKSPYISIPDYVKFIYALVKNYLPKSIVAIERNSNGEAIIASLLNTDIAFNIYFDNSKDIVEENINALGSLDSVLAREAARRKLYGIWTGPKTRERMFALLDNHISEYKDRFVGHFLISDLFSLVRSKTGKIQAGPGFHDDNIMSYNICLYLYYYGQNLIRYGFSRTHELDKEDKNYYREEDVMDYLSENDKKFFEGVYKPEHNYNDYIVDYIKQRRDNPFVNEEELTENKIPDMHTEFVPIHSHEEREKYEEMVRLQQWSRQVNASLGNLTESYKVHSDDVYEDDDFVDTGLFDYLNDMQ